MTEIFVKIDGVTGTATGAHHGWLVVSSAQLSSTEKNSVVISRVYDRLSNKLFKFFKDGTAIPTVTIDVMKGAARDATRTGECAHRRVLSRIRPATHGVHYVQLHRGENRAGHHCEQRRCGGKGMVIGGAAGRVDRH